MNRWGQFLLGAALVACDAPAVTEDGGRLDAASECAADSECDDGLYCNGAERCGPGEAGADDRGCVAAAAGPCAAGEASDESMDRCGPACEVGDADGDGHDALACGGDDCDDAHPFRFPGNLEVCELGMHYADCDPTTFGAHDLDADGYVDARCCNVDSAGTPRCGDDCHDLSAAVHPTEAEACDGLDNDCDGTVDEDAAIAGFADLDGDLHGDPDAPMTASPGASGFSTLGDDCDDASPAVHLAQVEICDLVDNDCDGDVDENAEAVTWYRDADGDGFGSADGGSVVSCTPVAGHSILATDCDDSRADVHPGAREECNGIDDDCNGSSDFRVGDNDLEDDDEDGFLDPACGMPGADCDDRDPFAYPGATEICDRF